MLSRRCVIIFRFFIIMYLLHVFITNFLYVIMYVYFYLFISFIYINLLQPHLMHAHLH